MLKLMNITKNRSYFVIIKHSKLFLPVYAFRPKIGTKTNSTDTDDDFIANSQELLVKIHTYHDITFFCKTNKQILTTRLLL